MLATPCCAIAGGGECPLSESLLPLCSVESFGQPVCAYPRTQTERLSQFDPMLFYARANIGTLVRKALA